MGNSEIGLTIIGILDAAAGLITMSIMLGRQLREIHATGERIAGMTLEVAFMIRRQSGDIDRDLQEIKELLGEQSRTGADGRLSADQAVFLS